MATTRARSVESVRADLAFHRGILMQSGNEFLATFAPAVEASLQIAFELQRSVGPLRTHFVPSHRAIFEAIRDRRPDLARDQTLAHLTSADADVLLALKTSAGPESAPVG